MLVILYAKLQRSQADKSVSFCISGCVLSVGVAESLRRVVCPVTKYVFTPAPDSRINVTNIIRQARVSWEQLYIKSHPAVQREKLCRVKRHVM